MPIHACLTPVEDAFLRLQSISAHSSSELLWTIVLALEENCTWREFYVPHSSYLAKQNPELLADLKVIFETKGNVLQSRVANQVWTFNLASFKSKLQRVEPSDFQPKQPSKATRVNDAQMADWYAFETFARVINTPFYSALSAIDAIKREQLQSGQSSIYFYFRVYKECLSKTQQKLFANFEPFEGIHRWLRFATSVLSDAQRVASDAIIAKREQAFQRGNRVQGTILASLREVYRTLSREQRQIFTDHYYPGEGDWFTFESDAHLTPEQLKTINELWFRMEHDLGQESLSDEAFQVLIFSSRKVALSEDQRQLFVKTYPELFAQWWTFLNDPQAALTESQKDRILMLICEKHADKASERCLFTNILESGAVKLSALQMERFCSIFKTVLDQYPLQQSHPMPVNAGISTGKRKYCISLCGQNKLRFDLDPKPQSSMQSAVSQQSSIENHEKAEQAALSLVELWARTPSPTTSSLSENEPKPVMVVPSQFGLGQNFFKSSSDAAVVLVNAHQNALAH